MKKENPRPAQMEFDLVSPWLVSPTRRQMEAVRKKAGIPKPEENSPEEKHLAGLTARLHALDLCDERGVSLNDELGELRTIVGPADWQKNKKVWTARGKRNVRRLKKIILVTRYLLNIC
jgi:hypothetical protein